MIDSYFFFFFVTIIDSFFFNNDTIIDSYLSTKTVRYNNFIKEKYEVLHGIIMGAGVDGPN